MAKEKRYSVALPIFATAFVKVTAKSKKEALEKAQMEAPFCVCHQCSRKVAVGDVDEANLTTDCVEVEDEDE